MSDEVYDQMDQPRHPEAVAAISGHDGNAFQILATTRRALRNAGVPSEEIEAFQAEATSKDYGHLLQTVMREVTVR